MSVSQNFDSVNVNTGYDVLSKKDKKKVLYQSFSTGPI